MEVCLPLTKSTRFIAQFSSKEKLKFEEGDLSRYYYRIGFDLELWKEIGHVIIYHDELNIIPNPNPNNIHGIKYGTKKLEFYIGVE